MIVGEGEMPVDRAFGIIWNIEEDKLEFKLKSKEKPMARRGMSIISFIYDPLELISLYLPKGKKILQNLCYDSLGWDKKIPENVASKWEYWKEKLILLKNIQIDRCLRLSCGFEDIVKGQCCYIRLVTRGTIIHCCLQIVKVSVSPKRFVSMPRMELTVLVLSVGVAYQLKRELSLNFHREILLADSPVALGYIRNETKKFKIIVENRVQFIQDNSKRDQWKYIPTNKNPADLASRGKEADSADKFHVWNYGPDFLWTDESKWNKYDIYCNIQEEDTRVKSMKVNIAAI